jgi:hypothetical protein
MASGLPSPGWNNADIEALDADLEALAAWYAVRDVPWGVRLPAEWDVPIGTPLFVKRCFGLQLATSGRLPAVDVGTPVRIERAGVADVATYASVDADVFGIEPRLARRWVEPVLGVPGFAHWLARSNGEPIGVACTVRSDDRAGPAAMLTGLGVRPGSRECVIEDQLLRAAVESAFAEGATLVHAYAGDAAEAEVLLGAGFAEVPGLQVSVVRAA